MLRHAKMTLSQAWRTELPASILLQIASTSLQVANIMCCVCKGWAEVASAAMPRAFAYQESSDRDMHFSEDESVEALRRFLDSETADAVVYRLLSSQQARDLDTVDIFCFSYVPLSHINKAQLTRLQHLSFYSGNGLCDPRPLLGLPHSLKSLDFRVDMSDMPESTFPLEILGRFRHLTNLKMQLHVPDEMHELHNGHAVLSGDISLATLDSLVIYTTYDTEPVFNESVAVIAADLTLRNIKPSCQVELAPVLVSLDAKHPSCVCFGVVRNPEDRRQFLRMLIPAQDPLYNSMTEHRYTNLSASDSD